MAWIEKKLQWGGVCQSCGSAIERYSKGWHEPSLQKVRCLQCGPSDDSHSPATDSLVTAVSRDPIGGTASIRASQDRHGREFAKGAAGEYLIDVGLRKYLGGEAMFLTDRAVPGTKSKIDHIVVAPSGIWIIDTNLWRGKIEYKTKSLTSLDHRLYVGGVDRTSKVEDIYNLVIPVAQVIEDRSIPVHAAMVFVEGDWSNAQTLRLARDKPHQHLGVWITWPRALYKMINERGPLDPESIERVHSKLDANLTPR
jgi:hypothetical protein